MTLIFHYSMFLVTAFGDFKHGVVHFDSWVGTHGVRPQNICHELLGVFSGRDRSMRYFLTGI